MKTASVRDIRQNFPRILAWVQDGEEVIITSRRKVVARMTPPKTQPKRKPATPDFAALERRIRRHPEIPAGEPSLIDLDREDGF